MTRRRIVLAVLTALATYALVWTASLFWSRVP